MSEPGKNIDNELEKQLENFLNIGIALSAEKDHQKLLEMILSEARRITGADAGTLYLVEDKKLISEIIHNDTMKTYKGGTSKEKADLPPVPLEENYVSGYVAITGKTVNIDDVYTDENFDFTGPRKYDSLTGYRTKSILVIPLKNHHEEVIGVLQLINALNQQGNITSFTHRHETVVRSLGSLAAISLTNQHLLAEIENLFESFVQVMVTAIDNITPYNATHTEKVSKVASELGRAVHYSNKDAFKNECFDKKRLKQLEMSGWLHDIGKISIPLTIMNKSTRLDQKLPQVINRIKLAKEQALKLKKEALIHQLDNLSDEKTVNNPGKKDTYIDTDTNSIQELKSLTQKIQEECKNIEEEYNSILDLIEKADNPDNIIDEDMEKKLKQIAKYTFYNENGKEIPLLTEEELKCLTISKGTLTLQEKKAMEKHVVMTEEMLQRIPFTRKLARVPEFSSLHHEFLDGSGYPRGLKGKDIPLEGRILALADIFDALTARDRPYKKGMSVEKALDILKALAEENKLDEDLYELFVENKIWEKV